MRPAPALALLVAALLAGCSSGEPQPATSSAPPTPETAMTRLTLAAGYDIGGIPWYETDRWKANVRVPSCSTTVLVGSNKAAQTSLPTTFEVLQVGDTALATLQPGVDAIGLKADALWGYDAARSKLGCS